MAHHHPNQRVAQLKSQVLENVKQGDTQAVRTVLQNCGKNIQAKIFHPGVYEGSVMKAAVEQKQIDIVRLLAQEFYPKVNGKTVRLEDALFDAISLEDEKMVETLVQLGADVNYVRHDETPLTAAFYNGKISMLDLLKRLGANINDNLVAFRGYDHLQDEVSIKDRRALAVWNWLKVNGFVEN